MCRNPKRELLLDAASEQTVPDLLNLPAGFARKKRVGLLNVKALGLNEDHRWILKLKHFNESLQQFDLRSLESVDSAKFFKESPALDRQPLFLPSPPSTDPPTATREEA